jgi:hypothetical protein
LTPRQAALRSFSFRLAAMFWILPRFGKIGVRILQHRILIAMPKLFLEANIARDFMVLGFRGPFRRILIVGAVFHESTSDNNSDETSLVL